MKHNDSVVITPNQLEAGATIPQALDNQYVSDDVYSQIVKNKKSLIDPNIAKQREGNAQNEFIRSLIYSSQVVINRAFISNNALLYNYYLPGKHLDAISFATMLNQGIIVPYLYKEKGFYDAKKFDISHEGQKASDYLSQFLNENIKCVRLSKDDSINEKYTNGLSQHFRQYFLGISGLNKDTRIEMLGELTGNQKEITDDEHLVFKKSLRVLQDFVDDTFDETENINRNDLYKKFLISPNTNVSDGVFLPSDKENPYRHEIKKLIDLKYNTNLPDMLGRYSFTPSGMPTRSALKDKHEIPTLDSNGVDRFIHDDFSKLAQSQRVFMGNSQRAMSLPVLSELSLADVLEVRNFESWAVFISLQSKILANPLSVGNQYDEFQSSFEKFQSELSLWYYRKYGEQKIRDKYLSIATIILAVGGRTIMYGMDDLAITSKLALAELPLLAGGIVVKLMMNVINPITRRIDNERSYSIEIMRSELELTRDEVRGFLESMRGSQIISRSDSMIAEQDRC